MSDSRVRAAPLGARRMSGAMEPKHRELLDRCHQDLLESVTDADRLIEPLVASGTLSPADRFELEQNCASSAEKVDHLLRMLANKDRDHFLDLSVALEKAYPDLHLALFGHRGGGPVDHSTVVSWCRVGRVPVSGQSCPGVGSAVTVCRVSRDPVSSQPRPGVGSAVTVYRVSRVPVSPGHS
ncbi:unnamed protein product [Merluccius merluccius]